MGVVRGFVKYLYSDQVSDDTSSLVQMFRIAHQYEVSCLVDKCSKRLNHKVSLENVYQLGKLAVEFDLADISNECAEFLAENFENLETEKLDTLPAMLLRKSFATYRRKMAKTQPTENVCGTKYVAKFFTNLGYSVKTPDLFGRSISTSFKVSRDTKLAGIGLFIQSGTTEALERLPIQVSLSRKGEVLTDLKFSTSSVASESKLLKIIFPSSVEIRHDRNDKALPWDIICYDLSIKLEKDCVVYRTDGSKRTLTVSMKSGELIVDTSDYKIIQIPVFYFED